MTNLGSVFGGGEDKGRTIGYWDISVKEKWMWKMGSSSSSPSE